MKKRSFDVVGRHKLCCVLCTINSLDVACSAAQSSYHHQIMKCRYLIASVENNFIVGCPVRRNSQSFYVIITKDFYKNEYFQKTIQQLNLTISEPQPVTPGAYLDCLKYTIDFYIAPQWNKIRNLYFKGENFLVEKEKNAAVKLNIKLNSLEGSKYDKISVELVSLQAKLFSVKLHHLCIPHSVIADFTAGLSEFIDVSMFSQPRVSVLPSMVKGRVMYIFKKIPSICPFKNWAEMRRHWKNMYGYRLPKTDEGILYYEIYFPMFNTNTNTNRLIYPDLCIRDELCEYSRVDDDVVDQFINDFDKMMPKLGSLYQEMKENNEILHELPQTLKLSKTDDDKICMKDTTNILKVSDECLTDLQDVRRSSRLSVSATKRLNHKQISAPISPTPSLLGKKCSSPNKLINLDYLKKIKEAHEFKPLIDNKSSTIIDDQSHNSAHYIFNEPSTSSAAFSNNFFIPTEESNSANIFSHFFHNKKLNVKPKNLAKKKTNQSAEIEIDHVNDYKRKRLSIISNEKVSHYINSKIDVEKNIKKFILKKN